MEVEDRPVHDRRRADLRPARARPPGEPVHRLHVRRLARRRAGAGRQGLFRPDRRRDPRGRCFVRRNTLERFGPVRIVRPELVFELHFEGIQLSTRHKSGLAVRFPRMARWRHDKKPQEADTLKHFARWRKRNPRPIEVLLRTLSGTAAACPPRRVPFRWASYAVLSFRNATEGVPYRIADRSIMTAALDSIPANATLNKPKYRQAKSNPAPIIGVAYGAEGRSTGSRRRRHAVRANMRFHVQIDGGHVVTAHVAGRTQRISSASFPATESRSSCRRTISPRAASRIASAKLRRSLLALSSACAGVLFGGSSMAPPCAAIVRRRRNGDAIDT